MKQKFVHVNKNLFDMNKNCSSDKQQGLGCEA